MTAHSSYHEEDTMGDFEIIMPGGHGIRMTQEENVYFKWTVCDVCNKPQDQLAGTGTSRDGEVLLWTCDECKAQGFNV